MDYKVYSICYLHLPKNGIFNFGAVHESLLSPRFLLKCTNAPEVPHGKTQLSFNWIIKLE